MTDRSFERANDESRRRLARLVESLTSVQLAVDLGEGWTVASALGHMGFWDRWQATRWMRMLAGTWTAESESILAAEHLANDALHHTGRAPRRRTFQACRGGGRRGRRVDRERARRPC